MSTLCSIPPDERSFDVLPDEVLARILEILMVSDPATLVISAPSVCRRWRAVCRDQISLDLFDQECDGVWVETPLKYPPARQYVPKVLQRFRWIRAITLKHPGELGLFANPRHLRHLRIRILSDQHIDTPLGAFEGLRVLCLAYTDITDKILIEQVSRCKALQKLVLAYCFKLSDSGIAALADGCKHLQHLDLTSCYDLTDRATAALVVGCKGLKYLVLTHCCKISDASVKMLTTGCAGLESLSVAGCSITDAAIQMLAAAFPDLKHLNVGMCLSITDVAVVALATTCSSLESLCLADCVWITDAAIEAVVAGCPKLRALDVSNCQITDAPIIKLAADCKNIERINVSWCHDITDEAADALLAGCTHLVELKHRGSSITCSATTCNT
jgi:hypothetical protein